MTSLKTKMVNSLKELNKAIPQTITLQCLTFLDFTSCHSGRRPTGSGQTYLIHFRFLHKCIDDRSWEIGTVIGNTVGNTKKDNDHNLQCIAPFKA